MALIHKREIIQPQTIIDFGIYGLISEASLNELEPMAAAGAISFKLYMGSENPLVPCPSDGAILEAFETLARLGLRCTVHAESTPILTCRRERLRQQGRNDDILCTDHAPHLPEEKRRESVWDVAPGFPGVESSMRLMLTKINRGRLTLCDCVRMASEMPARAFDLYPRKGTISVGADADIVLVDMTRRDVIRSENLHSLGRATPFDGIETIGLPVRTIVRGATVAKDGVPVGNAGWGRPVTRLH